MLTAYFNDGDPIPVLAIVTACLEHEPEQSDVVHDLLAYLAEQMTEMHRQRQQEARGFLDWLELRTGAQVDDLTNKTAVREYFARPAGELLGILEKNRKKLKAGIDPTGRDFMADVQREYDRSVAVLGPLNKRIAATDRLIDQIVYRLYGLTEDEIALVEAVVKE